MLNHVDFEFVTQTLPFFSSLTEQEQTAIRQSASRRAYQKGQTIYHSSSECLGLIIVIQGVVRSFLMSPDGKEVTLYRLWEGDTCILSASCLLKNITFDLSMDVQEDAELILIGSELYSMLMKQNNAVQAFTYQLTNNRFSDVMWMVEQVFFMSLDQRIAVFLLEECSKNHSDTIHMTHAEIACNIGSAREAVTRMLKCMQEDELLELFRGGIRILDRRRLFDVTQR